MSGTRRNHVVFVAVLSFTTSLVICGAVYAGDSLFAVSAVQQQKTTQSTLQGEAEARVVVKKSDFDPPVKITIMKTKKRGTVETNQTFVDEDDWMRGLEIHAINNSNKTVTYIGLELQFLRTVDQQQGLSASWPFDYGLDPFWFENEESMPPPKVRPIPPGRPVIIALSDREYDEIKGFLIGAGFPSSLKRLELRVIKVGFSDGSAWNAGRLYRRLPQGFRWRSPTDNMELDNTPNKKPDGSALSRTALFLTVGFDTYDGIGLAPFRPAVHARFPPLPTSECGSVVVASVNCNSPGFDCRYDLAELNPYPSGTQAIDTVIKPCRTLVNGVLVDCGSNRPSQEIVPCPTSCYSLYCGDQNGVAANSCFGCPEDYDQIGELLLPIRGRMWG